MADLQENLIAGKGKRQAQHKQKRFEQCQLKIKTLRNKNNELQKQCDNELESDIRQAVKQQTSFIQIEIQDMKLALENLAKEYVDPASKNKIKEMCNLASRQMQRNRRIMGQYLNRASSSSSYYRKESSSTAFRRSRTQFEKDIRHSKQRDSNLAPVYEGKADEGSMVESEALLSDIKAEQKMMAQRNQLIKQLEQKNNKINQIINEMGSIVGGEQHDMVNQIANNNEIAYENAVRANEELDDAQKYQKKGKKKVLAIATIIILVIIIAGGVVYFAMP